MEIHFVNTVYVTQWSLNLFDQSHDFSFIHKFYYENYYNETRAFMGCCYKYGPRTKVIKEIKKKGN